MFDLNSELTYQILISVTAIAGFVWKIQANEREAQRRLNLLRAEFDALFVRRNEFEHVNELLKTIDNRIYEILAKLNN